MKKILNDKNLKIFSHIVDGIGILFLFLKVTEIVNWSWWWILFPFFCLPAIGLLLIIIGIILTEISEYNNKHNNKFFDDESDNSNK